MHGELRFLESIYRLKIVRPLGEGAISSYRNERINAVRRGGCVDSRSIYFLFRPKLTYVYMYM
jgi:hypothetical protein